MQKNRYFVPGMLFLVIILGLSVYPAAATSSLHLVESGYSTFNSYSSSDSSGLDSLINNAVASYSADPTQFSTYTASTSLTLPTSNFTQLDESLGSMTSSSGSDLFTSGDASSVEDNWDDLFLPASTASGCGCGS